MSDRADLALIIMQADATAGDPGVFTVWGHIADAVIAAGYVRPQRIDALWELDLVGYDSDGLAILTADGRMMVRSRDHWEAPGMTYDYQPTREWLPVTVIHKGRKP